MRQFRKKSHSKAGNFTKMMDLFQQDIEIINIDETWISQTNFRRRKWRVSGTINTLPNQLIYPDISLIVALSNRGGLHFCISEGKTNLETFKIFMVYLMQRDQLLEIMR